ncbi:MAG: glycosyltransferase, partial [Candidatus Dadabacteria bacterium]
LLLWMHVVGDQPPQIITPEVIEFADFALASSPGCYLNENIQSLPDELRVAKTDTVFAASDFARLEGLKPVKHSGFNVGYIGTVDYVKMHRSFLKMSSAVNVPEIQFIICGGGRYKEIEAEARRMGCAERFKFKGFVEDIKNEIASFDVYGYPLCPETYASSELNLQEVMYAGVPPVVFPYGGVPHLVINDYSGLIVHSEREYTQAIEYLYYNPEERKRLGENARRYASQIFGGENSAKKFLEIYKRVLESEKKTRKWPNPDRIGESLPDVNPQADVIGSARLIASLGKHASHFVTSRSSNDLNSVLEAEKHIAQSLPVMVDGGIFSYARFHSSDPFLRLWHGLTLREAGKYPEAISEFISAMNLGCNRFYILYYIADAAYRAGNTELAREALSKLNEFAPDFAPARDLIAKINVTTDSVAESSG